MADSDNIEWRIIPSIQTHEVSSDGRVRRRFTDRATGQRGGSQWPAGKELSVQINRKGYGAVFIGGRNLFIHRLVCEAFNGPSPFAGAVVRHLDDDPSHNAPCNLAWGTMSENMADAKRNGRIKDRRTFSYERAFAMRASGMSYQDIAEFFGVTRAAIRNAVCVLVQKNQATLAPLQSKSLKRLVHPAGLEPATPAFGGQYSIQLSYGCIRCQPCKAEAAIILRGAP